jgi:hypothetical protein
MADTPNPSHGVFFNRRRPPTSSDTYPSLVQSIGIRFRRQAANAPASALDDWTGL